jgi:alpha-tubulin suppressor-like RCC1 family protein
MSQFPVDLPPTMLRTTLYTNKLIGNINVIGNITSNLIFAENIYGNLTSNNWYPGNITDLNVDGNVTAGYFIGNGALLTGITSFTLPSTANIDIVGNVTAPGNVSVAGQVTVTGNVVGNYFIGNGALLTGVAAGTLPSTANINIVGNVSAPGNIDVAGQVTTMGNVVGNYFIGNGALLTGISSFTLPSSANIDIVGNVTAPGNVSVAGQVTVTGNVVANYFIGNGALLTGVTSTLPSSANIDIAGNVIASSVITQQLTVNSASISLGVGAGFNANSVSIGTFAGRNNQSISAVAIGLFAGTELQGQEGISIGYASGFSGQGQQAIAIGSLAGVDLQGGGAVAIGTTAGGYSQGQNSVAIGYASGTSSLTANSIAIGSFARANAANGSIVFNASGAFLTAVNDNSLTIDPIRGTSEISAPLMYNTTTKEVTYNTTGNVTADYFIGNGSLLTDLTASGVQSIDIRGNVIGTYANVSQVITASLRVSSMSVRLGFQAGNLQASDNIIAIGSNSGARNQSLGGIAIGTEAGANVQGAFAIAIGSNAAPLSQGTQSIAIGPNAGYRTQGTQSVAIGLNAGSSLQGIDAVAIGEDAGRTSQSTYGTAIGFNAGATSQGTYGIAIGPNAGKSSQGTNGIAIGFNAGFSNQGTESIAIGYDAGGDTPQGPYSMAVGSRSGSTGSYSSALGFASNAIGSNTLALGAYAFANVSNSIVLNSTGSTLFPPGDGTLTIAPIRGNAIANPTMLMYNTTTKEVSYNTSGNVSADFFVGNGSLLTGISTTDLPATGSIDIGGNVIGAFANVANIIAVEGNVGNTRFLGGNVVVSGQVNALGNIVAPFFVGNGSQLAGISSIQNGSSNVWVTSSGGNIKAMVGGVQDVFLITTNTTEVGRNFITYGDVRFPNLSNSSAAYGNYTPVVADLTTGTLWKQPVEIPQFPGAQGFCAAGNECALLLYKNQVLASGLGWQNDSGRVAGWQSVNPVLAPVTFQSTSPFTGVANLWYQMYNAMALTTNGQVYCWGNQVNSPVPIRISLPGPAIQIAGALQKSNESGTITKQSIFAAILGNGQLLMWGDNTHGALGRGNTVSSNIPMVPVGLASANVIKVTISSAYAGATAALLANGQLYTWGYNSAGELGLGNTSQTNAPVLISGINNVTDVMFCSGYSGVTGSNLPAGTTRLLCSNGASFATGYNAQGQLAVGNTTNMTRFTRESSNRTDIAAIRGLTNTRESAHLIILDNGQVLFSGLKSLVGIPSSANATTSTPFFYNGDGFNTLGFQRNMLANVGNPITTPVVRYSAGPLTTSNYVGAIVDNTGNVYGVGYNGQGNFGNGTTTDLSTFQQLNQYFPENKRAINIIFSGYETTNGGAIVCLADGTIVTAGRNNAGSNPYEQYTGLTQTVAMPYYRYCVGFGPIDKI